MRVQLSFALVISSVAAGSAVTGCARPSQADSACTTTPFISPTSVTLDHAAGSTNVQHFSTGTNYSGKSCVVSAIAIAYHWAVSDPVTATVAEDGGVSCVAASLAPITVSSQTATYDLATGKATYVPTNLPTATLTCK